MLKNEWSPGFIENPLFNVRNLQLWWRMKIWNIFKLEVVMYFAKKTKTMKTCLREAIFENIIFIGSYYFQEWIKIRYRSQAGSFVGPIPLKCILQRVVFLPMVPKISISYAQTIQVFNSYQHAKFIWCSRRKMLMCRCV